MRLWFILCVVSTCTLVVAKIAEFKPETVEHQTEQQAVVTDNSKALVPAGVVISNNGKCCQCRNRCPTGPPGPCPSVKPATNAQCGGAGGVRIKCPDGDSVTICNGADGVAGPPGLNGTCPANCTGTVGPQGPPGFNGTQGPQGERGFNGTQGPQGERGFNGTQGPQGERGFNGTQGERGFNGTQGERGFNGTQGPCPTFGDAGETTDCPSGLGFNATCAGADTLICLPSTNTTTAASLSHIAFGGRNLDLRWFNGTAVASPTPVFILAEIGFGTAQSGVFNNNNMASIDADADTPFGSNSEFNSAWDLPYAAVFRNLSVKVDIKAAAAVISPGAFDGLNGTILVALYAANFSDTSLVYFPTTFAVTLPVTFHANTVVTPVIHLRASDSGNEAFPGGTRLLLVAAVFPPNNQTFQSDPSAQLILQINLSAGLSSTPIV